METRSVGNARLIFGREEGVGTKVVTHADVEDMMSGAHFKPCVTDSKNKSFFFSKVEQVFILFRLGYIEFH